MTSNDDRNSRQAAPWQFAAHGMSSLFRCFSCNGNKHTGGRKRVVRQGVKVWVCEACITPKDRGE